MHFQTVLVLVDILGHVLEQAGLVKLIDGRLVYGQISERCGVSCALGECTFVEVEVMTWSEEKDSLSIDDQ